jgi:hypothetical protein
MHELPIFHRRQMRPHLNLRLPRQSDVPEMRLTVATLLEARLSATVRSMPCSVRDAAVDAQCKQQRPWPAVRSNGKQTTLQDGRHHDQGVPHC